MKIQMTALSIAAVLALVGCSASTGQVSGAVQAPATSVSAPAVPTPTPSKSMTYKFGDTVKWASNLAVTLSAPAPFTPGPYAAGATQAANVMFTVTLTNGTAEPFDPALCYITVSSAGVEGDHVFDTAAGLSGGPTTKVLPGKTVTWKVAFSVADAADLVAEVTPSMLVESAIFTSK